MELLCQQVINHIPIPILSLSYPYLLCVRPSYFVDFPDLYMLGQNSPYLSKLRNMAKSYDVACTTYRYSRLLELSAAMLNGLLLISWPWQVTVLKQPLLWGFTHN